MFQSSLNRVVVVWSFAVGLVLPVIYSNTSIEGFLRIISSLLMACLAITAVTFTPRRK